MSITSPRLPPQSHRAVHRRR